MVRPGVADGEDSLQIWRAAANILNKQSRSADKGSSASYETLQSASEFEGFFGRHRQRKMDIILE
jgi:hypothetical protein